MITGTRRSVIVWTLAGKDLATWARHPGVRYYNTSDKQRSVSIVTTKRVELQTDGFAMYGYRDGYYMAVATVHPGGYYQMDVEPDSLDSWTEEWQETDKVEWGHA